MREGMGAHLFTKQQTCRRRGEEGRHVVRVKLQNKFASSGSERTIEYVWTRYDNTAP